MTTQSEIKKNLAELSGLIDSMLPDKIGFAMFLFTPSEDNPELYYLSNSERNSVIVAIEEWIEQVKNA